MLHLTPGPPRRSALLGAFVLACCVSACSGTGSADPTPSSPPSGSDIQSAAPTQVAASPEPAGLSTPEPNISLKQAISEIQEEPRVRGADPILYTKGTGTTTVQITDIDPAAKAFLFTASCTGKKQVEVERTGKRLLFAADCGSEVGYYTAEWSRDNPKDSTLDFTVQVEKDARFELVAFESF